MKTGLIIIATALAAVACDSEGRRAQDRAATSGSTAGSTGVSEADNQLEVTS